MSDESELSPEQEERVRRLLAQARVDEPVPGDVAARLDRVLARLGEGEDVDGSQVDELARRRRRNVTALLVAAAAVVVVGVGAGQLSGQRADDAGSTAASDVAPAPAAAPKEEAATADEPADGAGSSALSEQAAPEALAATADELRLATPERIRPRFFATDVARVRDDELRYDMTTDDRDLTAGAARAVDCEGGAFGEGDLYAVRYDGQPAVLAFRPAQGDTQVVDLLQCGTGDLLRSVTLPG